jgi:hypothetical protein
MKGPGALLRTAPPTVHAVCRDPTCDHMQELDLTAIVAVGHGDVPLIHLPLRCSKCGKTGHKIIVSGKSYGYDRPGVGYEVCCRSHPHRV